MTRITRTPLLSLAVLALAVQARAATAQFADDHENADGKAVEIVKDGSAVDEGHIKCVNVNNTVPLGEDGPGYKGSKCDLRRAPQSAEEAQLVLKKKKLWLILQGRKKEYALCWKGKPGFAGDQPIKYAKVLPKTKCLYGALQELEAGEKAEFKVVEGSARTDADGKASLAVELKVSKGAAAKKLQVRLKGDGSALKEATGDGDEAEESGVEEGD